MFARVLVAALAALPIFAAAGSPSNQCNTGPVQCCNSYQTAATADNFVTGFLSGVGVAVSSVTGQIGVTCSPLSVIGAGSSSCNTQPVCCTDNSFNGVVALGCSPINV